MRFADYKGPYYLENIEQFAETEEDLRDLLEDSEGPPVVWCCTVSPATIDYTDALENLADNMYEGFDWEGMNGLPELRAAYEAFNAANVTFQRWEVDYTRLMEEP